MKKILYLILLLFPIVIIANLINDELDKVELPSCGICAHRGASETHPENTITAFEEAIRLGSQMIEFDVRMTKDKALVVIHDETVDRTTNGTGFVSDFTLNELKALDAGSWKSKIFSGEKIPTFKETLEIMPKNIWLNIHLKGNEELGEAAAEILQTEGRIHQGVIACENDAARGVKKVNRDIMICNMERQSKRIQYINETIFGKYSSIQLLKQRDDSNLKNDIDSLKKYDIMVNYYFADTEDEVINLFNKGVNFILTNKLEDMLKVSESLGIKPTSINVPSLPKPKNNDTYVVAHRGAHNGIPENTLAAYKKAIELNCDFVEIDLRKTKDGKFVSVHNSTLEAYTQGKEKGKVNDYTLAELKAMNIGKRVGDKWENERIPTFEEILELCKGKIGIYLDLKEADIKNQIEIIKQYKMEKDIIWYIPATHMNILKGVQNSCTQCLIMPDPGSKENIAKVVKELRPVVIATDMSELNEEFMRIAKELKIKVIVDEDEGTTEEWDKILNWGTNGIQTNNPEKLIKYLKEKK